MGMIGRVLAAVASAIRRVVWRFVDGVLVPVIQTADMAMLTAWNFSAGLFNKGRIETEELVYDDAGDLLAASKIDRELATTPKAALATKATMGELAKRAATCRENGFPTSRVFNGLDPVHRNLQAWIDGLSEAGLRTIRHMPAATVSRHLDHRDAFDAGGGMPPFHPAPICLNDHPDTTTPTVSIERRRRRLRDDDAAMEAAQAYMSRRLAM